jgi:hypothetical protein
MKKKLGDLGVVLVVAALTAISAGAVLAPSTAGADDPVAVTNQIGGAEWSVALDKAKYEAGEKPVITVTAKNPGKEEITCESKIRLTTRNVRRMSRAPVMPNEVWSKDLCMTLKPGESKTVVLKPDKPWEEGIAFGAYAAAKSAPDIDVEPLAQGSQNGAQNGAQVLQQVDVKVPVQNQAKEK